MQIRVQEGENVEQMKMNLVQKGLSIKETKRKANKNTGFTAAQQLQVKSPTRQLDAKSAKQANLGTQNPETFGTRTLSPVKQ